MRRHGTTAGSPTSGASRSKAAGSKSGLTEEGGVMRQPMASPEIRHAFSADKTDQAMLEFQRIRLETLEADLARRQESYIRRERAYKTRVEELETQLEDLKEAKISWMTTDKSMGELKNMHKRIMNNVEIVQDRTAKILQEQERDLLRAFRARLFDVQTELEKEKSRRDDGAGAWIDKSMKLEGELDWTTEVADRLDRMNQQLLKENSRLKTQFKLQDEDRSYLTKQLVGAIKPDDKVAIKRDNVKLKQELDAVSNACRAKDDEIDRLAAELIGQQHQQPGGGGRGNSMGPGATRDMGGIALGAQSANAIKGEADHRFKEIIRKLKRTLDLERRNLRSVRERLSQELQSRTELQTFLRQCLEDVRKQISDLNVPARPYSASGKGSTAVSVSIDDFTAADREKTLSLLLSQDRVITLLYAKMFPLRVPNSSIERSDDGNASPLLGASSAGSLRLVDNERPGSAPTGTFTSQKPTLLLNSMMGSHKRLNISTAS